MSWDAIVRWIASPIGQRVLLDAVLPFVAILLAGVLGALIARSSVRRLLRRADRDSQAGVLAALVDAARQAAVWDSSSPAERILAERAAAEGDLRLRLLPLAGAETVADWVAHEIAELRRASATFAEQLDRPLAVFRDRLVEWHGKPRKSLKKFEADLARWAAARTEEERRELTARSTEFPSTSVTLAAGSASPAPVQPPAEDAIPGAPVARSSAPAELAAEPR